MLQKSCVFSPDVPTPLLYWLVTLETVESQMRESLAARTWPSLNWAQPDKKRIPADHKWLRGKWRLHEWGEVSKYCDEQRGQALFSSQHDVWELYGWPYLLPNETDKWRGGELSRRKNSALDCKLRTATQRWGSWEGYSEDECEFAVVVISLMQTVADKCITVFSRKVTPVQSIIFWEIICFPCES